MLKRLILTTILFLIHTRLVYAQGDISDQILTNLQTEETNIAEWLVILSEQPVNINQASEELLKKIPFLSDQHIHKIVQNRPFEKKTQIAEILGNDVYQNIRPFITVIKTKSYPVVLISHRFQYTFEKNRAQKENIFYGSPFESYSRIRLKLNANLSAGLLIQKDKGEQNYIDHYNAFIHLEFQSLPINLMFGNFYMHQAEGLMFSSPFSLPKSAHVLNTSSRHLITVSPLLSSNEANGFWGCAAEYGHDQMIKLLLFYSQIKRDGVKSEESGGLYSLYQSGYHRTLSEKENENTLEEKVIGGAISFPFYLFHRFGISFASVNYNPPLVRNASDSEQRRRYYNFYGAGINKYSMFYTLKFNRGTLSGEVMPESSNKIAQQHSFNLDLPGWQFLMKWWYMPRSFHSPFGRSIADSNPFPSAHQGILISGCGKPMEKLFLTSYWYFDKDLWRTFYSERPLENKDIYFQSEYRFNSGTHILLQYDHSSDQLIPAELNRVIAKKRHRLRLQFEKKISTLVRFRSRFDMIFLDFSEYYISHRGINFYQDLNGQLTKNIAGYIRFSSFYTDDYDSRIYEYESDLPGIFSNYALYGKGIKWYIMLIIKPTNNFRLLAKFRKIVYDGVETIGSGLTAIEGGIRQDIHIQLEFRY